MGADLLDEDPSGGASPWDGSGAVSLVFLPACLPYLTTRTLTMTHLPNLCSFPSGLCCGTSWRAAARAGGQAPSGHVTPTPRCYRRRIPSPSSDSTRGPHQQVGVARRGGEKETEGRERRREGAGPGVPGREGSEVVHRAGGGARSPGRVGWACGTARESGEPLPAATATAC